MAVGARRHRTWFSIQDACRWIEGIGEQSVRHRLNRLVEMGVLEKSGMTRSTVFRFSDPFRAIEEALARQRDKSG